jgi:PAS domain S-box-containing protein
VSYLLAGRLGFAASAIHPVVSSAWPPSGIALAALLLGGLRYWPGISLGAFLVNVTVGIAPLAATGIAVGNTLEAVIGAWLLITLAEFRPSLGRLRDVLALVVLGIAGTPISATIGVTSLSLSGSAAGISAWTAWLAWFAGDALGILVVAPVLLTWAAGERPHFSLRRSAEAAVLAGVLIAFTAVLFQTPVSYMYAIFPVTIWAGLRFGPRGAATASFVVSALAIWYTVDHVGPFATSNAVANLFLLETFIALLAVTTLILAGVIEERRAAESALERSRQEHRDIVHHATVGVYQTDSDGKILLANPALADMLGYDTPEQLVGGNMADDVYLDRTQWVAPIAQLETPVETGGVEVQWRRSDGSPIWVDLHARSVTNRGVGGAFSEGFVYNITGRKEIERQLGQAQKMEAVGQLASGVAHDFNNLLTVISTCADFVLSDVALPSSHRADLTQMKNATDRGTALTRQLLALGRTQVLRPATINLNDQLTELLPMFKRSFKTSIDMKLETAPDLWTVRADPGQIEQVLLNLALNARDAMPDGGTLTFVTANCVITGDSEELSSDIAMKPGDYVQLKVEDNGVGMDEATRTKIFEPFFTTKSVGKGSGLGLATAYGIVKQSGGYIRVRSTRGKGTEFLIYLPRIKAEPEKAAARRPRRDQSASGNVLVVDDEAGVRHVLQRILTAEGYTVVVAAGGEEALASFKSSNAAVDLLITDIVMPGMGGRQLARECRDLRDTLKVIYISGYASETLLSQQAIESGIEFVEKPFSRDAILDRVARVLST